MTRRPIKIIRLSEHGQQDCIRMLADAVSVDAGKRQSWVTVTRTGTFTDPRYGQFAITRKMLSEMIGNFDAGVYGQDIAIDVNHEPGKGAAGYIRKLQLDGGKLRALVEWTEYGIDAIQKKGFKYLSAEFCENFTDNEHQKQHGPTLLAAGLTVRPVIKGLDVVELSEADRGSGPTLISEQLIKQLHEEKTMWKKMLAQLLAFMQSLKLSEDVIASFKLLAEQSLEGIEDEAKAKLILDNIQNSAKKLAESHPNATNVTLQLSDPGKTLTDDDVKRILAEQQKTADDLAAKQKEKLDAKLKVLSDAINAAEGLDDSVKEELVKSLSELVVVEMADEQIKKLAEQGIGHANKEAATRKLSEMGFQVSTPAGQVQLSNAHSSEAARLQSLQHEQLRRTSAYINGDIRLAEDKKLPLFAKVGLTH